MKQIAIFITLITVSIIFSGCSNDETPEPTAKQFDNFVDKILGYYLEGQEETWFNQNESILSIYSDALTFHSADSLSLAYIGFGYGHDDLTMYSVLSPNYGSWTMTDNELTIRSNNGMSEVWKILEIRNEYITFKQELTGAIFSMKIMD